MSSLFVRHGNAVVAMFDGDARLSASAAPPVIRPIPLSSCELGDAFFSALPARERSELRNSVERLRGQLDREASGYPLPSEAKASRLTPLFRHFRDAVTNRNESHLHDNPFYHLSRMLFDVGLKGLRGTLLLALEPALAPESRARLFLPTHWGAACRRGDAPRPAGAMLAQVAYFAKPVVTLLLALWGFVVTGHTLQHQLDPSLPTHPLLEQWLCADSAMALLATLAALLITLATLDCKAQVLSGIAETLGTGSGIRKAFQKHPRRMMAGGMLLLGTALASFDALGSLWGNGPVPPSSPDLAVSLGEGLGLLVGGVLLTVLDLLIFAPATQRLAQRDRAALPELLSEHRRVERSLVMQIRQCLRLDESMALLGGFTRPADLMIRNALFLTLAELGKTPTVRTPGCLTNRVFGLFRLPRCPGADCADTWAHAVMRLYDGRQKHVDTLFQHLYPHVSLAQGLRGRTFAEQQSATNAGLAAHYRDMVKSILASRNSMAENSSSPLRRWKPFQPSILAEREKLKRTLGQVSADKAAESVPTLRDIIASQQLWLRRESAGIPTLMSGLGGRSWSRSLTCDPRSPGMQPECPHDRRLWFRDIAAALATPPQGHAVVPVERAQEILLAMPILYKDCIFPIVEIFGNKPPAWESPTRDLFNSLLETLSHIDTDVRTVLDLSSRPEDHLRDPWDDTESPVATANRQDRPKVLKRLEQFEPLAELLQKTHEKLIRLSHIPQLIGHHLTSMENLFAEANRHLMGHHLATLKDGHRHPGESGTHNQDMRRLAREMEQLKLKMESLRERTSVSPDVDLLEATEALLAECMRFSDRLNGDATMPTQGAGEQEQSRVDAGLPQTCPAAHPESATELPLGEYETDEPTQLTDHRRALRLPFCTPVVLKLGNGAFCTGITEDMSVYGVRFRIRSGPSGAPCSLPLVGQEGTLRMIAMDDEPAFSCRVVRTAPEHIVVIIESTQEQFLLGKTVLRHAPTDGEGP
ncbi:MAG: PilZ domain-containing protein [Magnetococcus sp. WYHC-3]